MSCQDSTALCEDESGRGTDIAVSLIGVTAGLEVCTFASGDPELPPDEWIEVTPAEASLSADHGVYVIRRRWQGGRMTTWIGIYRHAQEIDRDRPGNYYGAGLWLIGNAANARGSDILAVLEALRRDLLEWALIDGRFTRPLADLRQHRLTHLDSVADTLQRIYDSLEPAPPSDESAMASAPTAYVDATAYSDAAGGAAQLLLEWALDGTALFGSYSRVVIHTHPQTLSQAHRASLPNIVSPRQLRRMNSPAQVVAPAMAGAKVVISRQPRTTLRRRRKSRSDTTSKEGQSPLSYPARAIVDEEQRAQLQTQREPLNVSYFDPRSLPQWGGRKTAAPMNDVVYAIVVLSLVMLFVWLVHRVATI